MTQPIDPEERARRRRQQARSDAAAEVSGAVLPIVFAALILLLAGVVLVGVLTDFFDSLNPFSSTTEVAATDISEISLEPINLDCYGRVTASVPVRMSRDAKVFGRRVPGGGVAVDMTVAGRLITCVGPEASDIQEEDGQYVVTIDASKVQFEPATVDALATAESIKVSTGVVRNLVDVVPFVNPDNELTSEGMAYAQVVVDQACAADAWMLTQQAIIAAYSGSEADRLDIDPDDITVQFEGQPSVNETEVPETLFDGLTVEQLSDGARCYEEPGAATQIPVGD